MTRLRGVVVLGALAVSTGWLWAATSTAWEISGFDNFIKGRSFGLQLTGDGTLSPGPAVRFNVNLNQPALWSMAVAPDGSIFAATGHTGKVFRISPNGKAEPFWTAEETEVFALSLAPDGSLYAGTSPNGGIYRVINGKAAEIWHSPGKYIWAIKIGPDGYLYVASGENGRVYRVAPDGKSDIYYETGQANVTALAFGPNRHLYAGTDPNGLLYDISSAGKGTVLFDSTLPEIRSIIPAPDGCIYAVGMGGAVSTRVPANSVTPTASSGGAIVATNPTVITVTEAKQGGVRADAETPTVKPSGDTTRTATGAATQNSAAATVVEIAGVERSAIYRIDPSGTVETLRSSKEDNVYDLLLDGDSLIFSTDDHGRIYRLAGTKATLLAEPGDGETTRLYKTDSLLYAALSNPARLYAFTADGAGPGWYESQVHDATSVARWGHLQWRSSGPGITFQTRTGNSTRPDKTWSPWSAPVTQSGISLITSPQARFIQWRAEWASGSSAELSNVDVPYLPQNGPPQIRSISVTSILGTNSAKAAAGASASSSAYSVTVTDTGSDPASPATSASPNAPQTVSRLQTTQTQISWQADDPDGDKLVYSLYFRAEDEHEWQLIRSHMTENTLLLDPDVFADGRYFFRVIASDAPSNAAEFARTAELTSTPVLIDNSPPLVSLGVPSRDGSVLDIDVEASDKTSPLRLCQYSLDAGSWLPVEAADGITDSPHERFHLHLDKLRPGEHLLVFRVYDSAGNAGLARVVLR